MSQSQKSFRKHPEASGRKVMSLELREFLPSEYGRLAEARNSQFPDHPVSAHELKSFDDNLDKTKYYFHRYTCFDERSGKIVGFGTLAHLPWMFNPHRYSGNILVDKAFENQGAGQFLYENLMKRLADLNASEVWAFAKEDMQVSLTFLSKRGLIERFRTWESRLDPRTVNISKFSNYTEKASKAGVEISSLAMELKTDPDCHRKLHELSQTLMSDVPMPEPYTPISYEQWLSFDMKDPGLLPEAYAIAKDGARYVGLSTVRRLDKEPRGLSQLLTGVRREYRGKGVAFAMKRKVIEWAQRNGYDLIKTDNATTNAEMLGINVKLGFKRQVGSIAFSKSLA